MNKYVKPLMRVLALVAAVNSLSATTGFNFGKGSGIIVLDGTLDLTNGARIVDGFIENNGGSIATDCTPIVGTNATWAGRDGAYYSSITFDGTLKDGDRLSLGSNQTLVMNGTPVEATPTVNGSHCHPAVIRGIGSEVENGEIRVNSGSTVSLNIAGVLSSNINLKGNRCDYEIENPGDARAVMSLAADLNFAPTYGPITHCVSHPGVNKVEFNGNRMTFGGDANALDCHNGSFSINHAQIWNNANVTLSGPIVMGEEGSITFDTPGYVNGAGNTLHLGESSAALSNGYNEVNLIDLTLNSGSNDVFNYSNAAWNCANTTFTSNNGSITVDGAISRTSNVFDNVRFGHPAYIYEVDGGFSYTALKDANNADIFDDGRQVYRNPDSGIYVEFDGENNPVIVELTPTAVYVDSALVPGTQGALFATATNGSSIWYNASLEESYVQYSGSSYYQVTIAFSRVVDGNGNPVIDLHYRSNQDSYLSLMQGGNGTNITDGEAQLYVHQDVHPDGRYVKYDDDVNPYFVELVTSLVYVDAAPVVGTQGFLFGTDINGNPVYRDATAEGAYVQPSGLSDVYYRVTIAFNRIEDLVTTPYIAGANVRLNSDVSIDGDWIARYGTTLTIDLNGHALDLSDGELGSENYGTVVVKNGTLKGLGCGSLDFNSNSTLILENVELHLGSHVRWDNAELKIKGKCRFVGRSRSVFDNQSTANFTITPNSTLTLEDGVIYSHNNNGETNFNFCNSSSHLELMGATFRRPDAGSESSALELTVGTIIIDHKSVMQPGSNGIQFGDGDDSDNNLSIIVRPGATLSISSDNCADVSSGTITYANVSSC